MRLQLQKGAVNASSGDVYYQSMLHGLRRVSREEGVYWLWRPGVEPTWLRAFSSTGLRIGLYNSVKNSIQATVSPGHDDRDTIPLSVKILAGGTLKVFVCRFHAAARAQPQSHCAQEISL